LSHCHAADRHAQTPLAVSDQPQDWPSLDGASRRPTRSLLRNQPAYESTDRQHWTDQGSSDEEATEEPIRASPD
jgi:hypothetical protein